MKDILWQGDPPGRIWSNLHLDFFWTAESIHETNGQSVNHKIFRQPWSCNFLNRELDLVWKFSQVSEKL